MLRQRVIIMGAAGRDFHNFNMVFRNDPSYEVKAFTAAQIPFMGGRIYPAILSGPLYPAGIPIRSEEELETLIREYQIDRVVFSYSDVSHEYVMHRASLCLSLGADFILLGPDKTMLHSERPVISVCAVRTGCGKSGVTQYIARILKAKGLRPVVIRHPMPYCDLVTERCQRFGSGEDLDRSNCSVEEREEFEPLIRAGIVVYAGVDYAEVLKSAEGEADIIIWDGGNNDLPFIRPDLEVVVFDPHRPGHELVYHPGETNMRRADIAVINKVDTAERENIAAVEKNIAGANPRAKIVHTASPISADFPEAIKGKRVLVVEDGPTLTHGGMPYGAGFLAAKKFGAAGVVDPRPYAVGSIKDLFNTYPHLESVLPAMGYSTAQKMELRETIERTPCDLVLIATPTDLRRVLDLKKDAVRIRYEIEEADTMGLRRHIEDFADRALRKR